MAVAGAGIALRDQGYQGELTLIGEESQLPYERPPLSKAVLIGEADEPDWVGDEATYADKGITLRLGTMATRIDRNRKVVVASRTEYPYDKLLIATWNIANLGVQQRSDGDHAILAEMISWFDLVAIQETNDNLSGLRAILERLPANRRILVSEAGGNQERGAFVYDSRKVSLLDKVGRL